MKPPYSSPSQLPPGRKTAFYLGKTLMGIGYLIFFSVFVTAANHFGDFRNFEQVARSSIIRGFTGVFLVFVGDVIAKTGAQGLFGAGMLLDPEQAERDLEPWARMSGRLDDAAFSEMSTVRETISEAIGGRQPGPDGSTATPEIKIRCRACQALNDEQARFCDQCGAKL